MDPAWQETFRNRMRQFEAGRGSRAGETAVSIKVRVRSGCFHRDCSPRAYQLIDGTLATLAGRHGDFGFEEHESGPEILVYVAAGLTLAKSVIDLVTTIIKARRDGIKKGDRPSEPVELIVRRVHTRDELREETVLRIAHTDTVGKAKVEKQLTEALRKLLKD